ncbi:MAG: hypothetical protein COV59_03760 [Candidatus Magasanikbacteria bacterium CG11_big_fil_rev_8_21_14_0_20_39_34]|uniref:Glycosyl transferase family 1 domain-containing protein n=1 Tax=Candidatus Magasanikbacteria bacterium CG11_big_fil_rev_8_21_14_0_20_39_34 TaxID=1974653 RepID=A0A2H0N4E7_9BACT|nr:MAG: hypothetical protein COV59_03760 [Candidatus Magasanikbacteria bacterium CG11_big_fil_rev_8_21_14_0_20_39_34]
MKILVLGSDSNVLHAHSNSQERALSYSTLVEKYIVVVPAEEDLIQEVNERLVVSGVKREFSIFTLLKLYKQAKQLVKKYNVEIVSAQNPFEYALLGYFLKRSCGIRLHIQEHGDFFSYTYWRNEKCIHFFRYYLGKFLIKKADSVRVVSKKIQHTLEGFGLKSDRITVIPVFVPNVNSIKIDRMQARVCVCIIRFVKQKNPLMLLRAWKHVLEKQPDAKLILVGKGEMQSEIKQCIKNFKLEKSVQLHGWTNDTSQMYKKADLHVLSSNYEGWGRVVIEAAVQGLPTVMTDVGCAGEFIENETSGLITSINDEKAFADAIIRIMQDDAFYRKLCVGISKSLQKLPNHQETLRLYLDSWKKALL